MIIIKTLHFEDYEDFACAVSDTYDRVKSNDEYNTIDVVAKYEDVKQIIYELIGMGYGIAFVNELANPEYDGYDDAFVISLLDDEIWCEPVKRDDKYIFVEADVVYIFDDCNSKIIPNIESDEVYEVEIGDFDYDCENCEYHDMTTTSSASSYRVNGKEVSEKEYYDKLANVEAKFQKHMEIVLNDYADFIDEMKNWKDLLSW